MKRKIKQDPEIMVKINITQLKKMANTKKLRDIIQNNIEQEKIMSVRNAWIEYFLEIKNKKILLNKR